MNWKTLFATIVLCTLVTCEVLAQNREARTPYSYGTTDVLVPVGLVFSGLHVIDNVASRRTFASGTVLPTLTQLTYLGGLVAYELDAGPLFWTTFSSVLLVAHAFGHYLIPDASHHISTFDNHWSQGDNRFGLESSVIGAGSQGILISLDLTFAAVLVSSIIDGSRCGFTLGQRGSC